MGCTCCSGSEFRLLVPTGFCLFVKENMKEKTRGEIYVITDAYHCLQHMPTKSWGDVGMGFKVENCCFTCFNAGERFSNSQILA